MIRPIVPGLGSSFPFDLKIRLRMTLMRKYVRRWMLAAALTACGGSALFLNHRVDTAAHAADQAQVAGIEQLKADAFRALRGGEFSKVDALLAKAASQSGDPTLSKMSGWAKQFESQRKEFAAE